MQIDICRYQRMPLCAPLKNIGFESHRAALVKIARLEGNPVSRPNHYLEITTFSAHILDCYIENIASRILLIVGFGRGKYQFRLCLKNPQILGLITLSAIIHFLPGHLNKLFLLLNRGMELFPLQLKRSDAGSQLLTLLEKAKHKPEKCQRRAYSSNKSSDLIGLESNDLVKSTASPKANKDRED